MNDVIDVQITMGSSGLWKCWLHWRQYEATSEGENLAEVFKRGVSALTINAAGHLQEAINETRDKAGWER